jgi:hypothetical protein
MKMFRRSFTARLLDPPPTAVGNEIEFSANLEEFGSQGLAYRCLIFKDAQRTISYQPPSAWICALVGKHLYLKPPNQNFAAAEIKAVPLVASQSFDKIITAALTEQVLANVPEGTLNKILVKEEMDTVSLNNHQSYEVTVSYEALSQTFRRSVLFINTPANRIVFKFTAREGSFDALHQAFRNSILTWEWHSPPQSSRRDIIKELAAVPR